MTDRELMQHALDALEGYARNCRCEGGGAPCDAAEALRARLTEPEPYAAQAVMVAGQTQGRMYVDAVTGDVGIGNPNQVTLDTSGATGFSLTPIGWDASAPSKTDQDPVAWYYAGSDVEPNSVALDAGLDAAQKANCIPLYAVPPKIFCGCGDQIMPDDGAECGNCVTARNAVKQEPLAQMKEMLEVQGRDGTWNYDPYLQGMFNGMEFMVALAEGRDPVFREAPERWLHTPPQREWQGLTDEEIKDTLEAAGMDTWFSYRHAARAIEAKLKEKNG